MAANIHEHTQQIDNNNQALAPTHSITLLAHNSNPTLNAIRIDNFDNLTNDQLADQCDLYVARVVMAISHLHHNPGVNQVIVTFNGQQTIVRRFDEVGLQRCLFILQHISSGLRMGILVAKRGILYYYMHRLGKDAKDTFPTALKKTINGIGIPTSLLYSTEPTTLAYGDVCIKNVKTGVEYDLLKREQLDASILNYKEWMILRGEIKMIIVVEKATLFRQIMQTDFHKQMNAIILTDRGYPTLQGKAWLRNFCEWFQIDESECYGVGDFGPHGYSVLHAYEYVKDPIKCENIFRTRLRIVMTPALMKIFPEASNAENTEFSEADLNIFKFLFDEENEFFRNNREVRMNQLIKMYKGKFKCDVDLLDIRKLLAAVKKAIGSGIVM